MFSYEFWDISCYRTPPVAASASLLSDKIPTEKILYIFIFLTWNFLLIYYQLGLKTFTLNGFWHLRKQEGAVIFHLFFHHCSNFRKLIYPVYQARSVYTTLPTMFCSTNYVCKKRSPQKGSWENIYSIWPYWKRGSSKFCEKS